MTTSNSNGMIGKVSRGMRIRYFGPAISLVALALGVAATAGASPPEMAPYPPEFRSSVVASLFSGPPNYSAVAVDALARASKVEREAIRDGAVSKEDYLTQAGKVAACVAERVGAEVTTPILKNGRAVWTMKVGQGHTGPLGSPQPPSVDVVTANRDCHGHFLGNVERLWLSSTLPQGNAWHELRNSFVRCLASPDNAKDVSAAMFKELSEAGDGACMQEFALLFESIR